MTTPSDPATAVADENQLVSGDQVFAYLNGFGNTEHAAIVGTLNSQGVPDLFVGSSCECWNQPFQHPDTFGFGTDYPDEGRLMGSYAAHTFPTAKIGYIWENSPIGCCQQGVRELDAEIPPSQVVTRQPFTLADIAATRLLPQVQAAQAAGAQVLVLDTLAPQATALVLLDAASIGYHPVIIDNVIIYGMTAAYNFTRALQAAGPHPTRQSLVAAVNSGAVNFGGPGLIPLAYSPLNHDGYPGEQIGTVQNGGIALSGPVYATHSYGPVIPYPPIITQPPHHF